MITAMTLLLLLLLTVVATSVATLRLIARDGRGPQRPPRSHPEDGSFLTRP